MICWTASDGGHLVDSCPWDYFCVLCFGMLLPRCNSLHFSGALRPGIDIGQWDRHRSVIHDDYTSVGIPKGYIETCFNDGRSLIKSVFKVTFCGPGFVVTSGECTSAHRGTLHRLRLRRIFVRVRRATEPHCPTNGECTSAHRGTLHRPPLRLLA